METVKNKITKIKICNELMKVLEINKIENFNKSITKKFNEEVKSPWLESNYESLLKVFDIRTNKYKDRKYYNIYLLLKTTINHLFDRDLLTSKRIMINKIKYNYYIYNDNIMEQHKEIMNKINENIFD